MSHTITIGPVGLDIPLHVPALGGWSGDTLSLKGTIGTAAASPTLGRVQRDQFQGLAQKQGQLLACTFADSPELDGWYAIGRPRIDSDGASFENGVFDWSIDLERPRAGANVLQELTLRGNGRSNSHTFTTVRRGWYCPGVGAFGIDDGTGSVNAPTRLKRTGADGSMLVVVDNPSGTLFLNNPAARARWYVAPADAYRGSCAITLTQDGTACRVVGDMLRNEPTRWAMTNTLLSVVGSSTANVAEWTMVWNDGSQYESSKTFRITTDSSATEFAYGPMAVQVIRSTQDVCALRLHFGARNVAIGCYLDVVLRRGARHAEFRWTATGGVLGVAGNWGVKTMDAEAGWANHTSGLHASTADSDGNKVILTSPSPVTTDTTNGRMRLTSTSVTFPFMVGAEMAGAGAGFDDFTSIVYQYMGLLGTRQRAVVV